MKHLIFGLLIIVTFNVNADMLINDFYKVQGKMETTTSSKQVVYEYLNGIRDGIITMNNQNQTKLICFDKKFYKQSTIYHGVMKMLKDNNDYVTRSQMLIENKLSKGVYISEVVYDFMKTYQRC